MNFRIILVLIKIPHNNNSIQNNVMLSEHQIQMDTLRGYIGVPVVPLQTEGMCIRCLSSWKSIGNVAL